MGSKWFIPDAKNWRDEENYNPAVAAALACAADKLRPDGGVDADLLDCVTPVLGAKMSRSQQLRVLYIVCACRAAEDPPTPALEPIDEALELAIALDEPRALIDLSLLRAYVNRYIQQYPDAADDLRDCLEALETLKRRGEWLPEDTLKALTAMLRLAVAEFNTGAYDECQRWLDKATALLPEVGEHIDSLGRLTWNRALLLRWRGAYEDALTEAVSAVGYYRRLHDPEMLSRIEAVTGEFLLDLAEQSRAHGEQAAFADYVARAEPYIQRAVAVAVASDFMASEVGARIIRARLQLLQGIPGDRKPLLEELASMARQNQDMALVCNAYTGVGRECEAVFDTTSAKEWYRRAIAVVKDPRIAASAVWPQRALWRLEGEMDGEDLSADPSGAP